MARRFRGSETFKVDAKGRVSIPASFRRVIEAGDPDWAPGERPQIVIVYGGPERNFLQVYTMEAIYEIDERIDMMQHGSPERAEIEELMYGQSHQTDIDGDGRLVLPQKLREKIGLANEAFFVSAGTSFKIWTPEAYAADQAELFAERSAARPKNYDPLVNLPNPARSG
ncbi:division/cell wall cluster transcriptional repressor MraZ [Pseudothioclava arenosa]|uniref:Transcriptional regulator MraZ n=1 Tax=Pseudothioclava arenosa TaxID=1795308 RepID=A0A2A4CTE3_9RHOB|nr:division/cell wall cluster transcriptional repressor MraZ [Pseudothioclava arenosa]PCD77558.1 transcriptional regulator MraZ [Pseudothioclava arenosa]